MSAKQTPCNVPHPALAPHLLLCSNEHTGSDIYYLKDNGKAGLGIQWGNAENQWTYFTLSQLFQVITMHLEALKAPVSIRAAVGAAALALDRDHVEPKFFTQILQAMHETSANSKANGNQHAQQALNILDHMLASMQLITGQQTHDDDNSNQDSLSA